MRCHVIFTLITFLVLVHANIRKMSFIIWAKHNTKEQIVPFLKINDSMIDWHVVSVGFLTAKSVSACFSAAGPPCIQLQSSNSSFSCALGLFLSFIVHGICWLWPSKPEPLLKLMSRWCYGSWTRRFCRLFLINAHHFAPVRASITEPKKRIAPNDGKNSIWQGKLPVSQMVHHRVCVLSWRWHIP